MGLKALTNHLRQLRLIIIIIISLLQFHPYGHTSTHTHTHSFRIVLFGHYTVAIRCGASASKMSSILLFIFFLRRCSVDNDNAKKKRKYFNLFRHSVILDYVLCYFHWMCRSKQTNERMIERTEQNRTEKSIQSNIKVNKQINRPEVERQTRWDGKCKFLTYKQIDGRLHSNAWGSWSKLRK